MAIDVPDQYPPSGANGGNNGDGSYTGENIKILEGLEAVRLRPAMYIGSTGEMGLHHLVYEVVDNSVDEALAGYARKIDVVIHVDNSITVVDDGRGIPVDMMPVGDGKMMPAVQVVLTKLHAGGKFDASTYKVSGGLHGVGVSCVNALSQEFNVEIWRDGSTWEMDFSCGLPTSDLRKSGTSKRRGTKVHFLPDRSIFTVTEYNYDTLAQRLKASLSDLAGDIRKAIELGRGLDKVLLADHGDRYVIYARRLFRDRARFALAIYRDGRVVLPDGKELREFRITSRFGITVRGDYVRFADPHGTDLGRVAIPWIAAEDRDEIARRIGQLVHATSPSDQV